DPSSLPAVLAGVAPTTSFTKSPPIVRPPRRTFNEVMNAPDRWTYTDLAITPPQADEFESLDLYHATSGGEAALARKRREDAIRVETDAHHHHAATEAAE